MKLILTQADVKLLSDFGIQYDASRTYSEDEALAVLEAVREAEAYYAQGEDRKTVQQYNAYAELGDRIFAQIPEE